MAARLGEPLRDDQPSGIRIPRMRDVLRGPAARLVVACAGARAAVAPAMRGQMHGSRVRGVGVEFGGYQDHSVNSGCDVLTLGYDEFIPPTVKAVQQCWTRLDELEKRIAALE